MHASEGGLVSSLGPSPGPRLLLELPSSAQRVRVSLPVRCPFPACGLSQLGRVNGRASSEAGLRLAFGVGRLRGTRWTWDPGFGSRLCLPPW